MIEIWNMDPITAGAALRGRGFSAQEASSLVALKRRRALRIPDGPTAVEKRLLFARWLVQNARLNEGERVSWDRG